MTEFLDFTRQQEHCRLLWLNSFKESRRLQKELDIAMKSIAELETKLYHARRILDQECKSRREAEEERDSIVRHFFGFFFTNFFVILSACHFVVCCIALRLFCFEPLGVIQTYLNYLLNSKSCPKIRSDTNSLELQH